MKKIILLVVFLINAGTVVNFAQSDYEMTQQFKATYQRLGESIKTAQSIEELDSIGIEIAMLKNDFIKHKNILDNALYPDDFEIAFEKLNDILNVRLADYGVIVNLTEQVGYLNEKNDELITQIGNLEAQQVKDTKAIDSLKTLVESLRGSIRQRDKLVMSIVDSLLNDFVMMSSEMSEVAGQKIAKKVDEKNLFENVKRSISDNIEFLEVTVLTSEDLSEMKEQQKLFTKRWKQIGPKLGEVYLGKKERAFEISNIDERFDEWNYKIDQQIWGSINRLFSDHQLTLLSFANGEEFVASLSKFIDDEINNIPLKDRDEVVNTYFSFVDSVWTSNVEPNWIPVLLNHKLITDQQNEAIDAKLSSWEAAVDPRRIPLWAYIIAGLFVLANIAFLFIWKRRLKPLDKVVKEEKKDIVKEDNKE